MPPIPSGIVQRTWFPHPPQACKGPHACSLSQAARCQDHCLLWTGSAEQSHPRVSSPRTTSWQCSLGQTVASALEASQPPTGPSMPQRVGGPGHLGVGGRGASRRMGTGSRPWSEHSEGHGDSDMSPLRLQDPVGPESSPARMEGVRVCSGCAARGETAPMTTAAAPCSQRQVRSLPQGTAGRAGRPGKAGCPSRETHGHTS